MLLSLLGFWLRLRGGSGSGAAAHDHHGGDKNGQNRSLKVSSHKFQVGVLPFLVDSFGNETAMTSRHFFTSLFKSCTFYPMKTWIHPEMTGVYSILGAAVETSTVTR